MPTATRVQPGRKGRFWINTAGAVEVNGRTITGTLSYAELKLITDVEISREPIVAETMTRESGGLEVEEHVGEKPSVKFTMQFRAGDNLGAIMRRASMAWDSASVPAVPDGEPGYNTPLVCKWCTGDDTVGAANAGQTGVKDVNMNVKITNEKQPLKGIIEYDVELTINTEPGPCTPFIVAAS